MHIYIHISIYIYTCVTLGDCLPCATLLGSGFLEICGSFSCVVACHALASSEVVCRCFNWMFFSSIGNAYDSRSVVGLTVMDCCTDMRSLMMMMTCICLYIYISADMAEQIKCDKCGCHISRDNMARRKNTQKCMNS